MGSGIRYFLVALAWLAAAAGHAAAGEPPATALVRQVIDGEILAIDGGEVRLSGIIFPGCA